MNLTNLTLVGTNGNFTLQGFSGKNVVLYFYPKDNTAGCTKEACDFAHHYQQFINANTYIFGVSKDSLKSHHNFKAKFNLPFELISDENQTLCTLFDAIKLKKMYGREYLGIERSTFLLDGSAKIIKEWRNVKVKDHVTQVLNAVNDLH